MGHAYISGGWQERPFKGWENAPQCNTNKRARKINEKAMFGEKYLKEPPSDQSIIEKWWNDWKAKRSVRYAKKTTENRPSMDEIDYDFFTTEQGKEFVIFTERHDGKWNKNRYSAEAYCRETGNEMIFEDSSFISGWMEGQRDFHRPTAEEAQERMQRTLNQYEADEYSVYRHS